ncbi:MAG: hypothetical protein ACTS4U_00110 [Candidatus Hodgkinia cicadicola]
MFGLVSLFWLICTICISKRDREMWGSKVAFGSLFGEWICVGKYVEVKLKLVWGSLNRGRGLREKLIPNSVFN